MYRDIYKYYTPQSGFRQVRLFIIIFGIFGLFGLLPFFFGMPVAGAAVTVFCLLVTAGLLMKAAGLGRKYGIGDETLLLKSGSSEKILLFDDIKSMSLLSRRESRSFMEDMYRSSIVAEQQLDFRGWMRSQRRSGEVVRYLSVPVTGSDLRVGHPANIVRYSVKPDAELLLLRTTDGGYLLISPGDIGMFHNSLQERGVSAVSAAEGEGEAVHPQECPEAEVCAKRRSRGLLIYSVLVGTALILYFVAFPLIREEFLTEYPEDVPADSPVRHEDASELLSAAWKDENSFVFTVSSDQLSDIERGGGVSGDIYERYAAPLVLKSLELDGLLAEGSSEKQDLIDYTASILIQARITNEGEQAEEEGESLYLFRMERAGLREIITAFLRIRENE